MGCASAVPARTTAAITRSPDSIPSTIPGFLIGIVLSEQIVADVERLSVAPDEDDGFGTLLYDRRSFPEQTGWVGSTCAAHPKQTG
jgi:hypothetical protein